MRPPTSPFTAASARYLEALEQLHTTDPTSVDPGWRYLFEALGELERADTERSRLGMEAAILATFRDRGHLAADLDPLHLTRMLDPTELLAPQIGKLMSRPRADRASDDAVLLRRMISRYCGTLGVETAHIDDPAIRTWVWDAVEHGSAVPPLEIRHKALEKVVAAEEFERFMAVKFPAKKRFGAEGAETLIPMLDRLLRLAATGGVGDVVIGAMHRGRLNIAANVLAKPLVQLFAEFKGTYPFAAEPSLAADVPYHLGCESELTFDGQTVRVTLSSNPSHLEAVKPVVLGRVRARQDIAAGPTSVLGILVHTDASVVGQGIVAETLQLGELKGFATAGTIHIIVNNQIGFTTDASDGRTSRYCTGPWKAVDSPLLHINGDDPDAAVRAAEIAFAFRQIHRRDAVIDLVCYRRNGHNEIDEPRFTHPRHRGTARAGRRDRPASRTGCRPHP